jgi:hypothetical protein
VTPAPQPTPTDVAASTEPPVTLAPTPSPDPCAIAVTRVGTFVERIGGAVVALRPLIVVPAFDAAKTLAAMRRVSELMTAETKLPDVVRGCPSADALASSIEAFQAKAAVAVQKAIAAGFAARGQRRAAVTMFKLLPTIIEISNENVAIATQRGLEATALVVSPEDAAPLGKLPKLPK